MLNLNESIFVTESLEQVIKQKIMYINIKYNMRKRI